MTAPRAIITAVLILLLLSPAAAQAKLHWHGCPEASGPECTTIRVPLDRARTVGGRIGLHVARVSFTHKRGPYLMYLSGGPGGAGVTEMVDVLFEVPELLSDFTVFGFDQRGTGSSGLLRCREIEHDGRLRSTRAGERCAQRLGVRRSFYTTPDSVEDMEAIRRAVGAPKLTLFGISYGTELALAYAHAHPDRVDRLILDSVVDPDDADPFGLAGFRAMPRTLTALCPAGCRGVSTDPGADLASLTAKLRTGALRGAVYGPRGRRTLRTLRPTAIADLLYDADYQPALRAGIPVAVRAALDHGDAAPMLRLLAAAKPLSAPSDPRDFSAARYATVCEETPLPWPRGTPLAERLQVARERALALPPSAFFPFDAEVAYADEIDLCLRWPDPGRAPAPKGGAYPAVPTLILQGEEDLRTPPETSARLAALIPGSIRTTVPGVGHAIVGADPSGCGIRQITRFLARRPVRTRCKRVPTDVPATGVPPTALAQLAPARGIAGRAGRTVSAIDATLADLDFAVSPALDQTGRGGGLRGGTFRVRGDGRLVLARFVVVPGVRIGGSERHGGALRLRVRGSAAAHGTVTVTARGRLHGRLAAAPCARGWPTGPRRRWRWERNVARAATVTPAPARPR